MRYFLFFVFPALLGLLVTLEWCHLGSGKHAHSLRRWARPLQPLCLSLRSQKCWAMGLLGSVFPALLPVGRSHKHSCSSCSSCICQAAPAGAGGEGGAKRVHTPEVLLFLMGLALRHTVHLVWKVFFSPFVIFPVKILLPCEPQGAR